MPSASKKQRAFMFAELARKKRGEQTDTGMSEQQLEDFAHTKDSQIMKAARSLRRHKGGRNR